LIFAEEVKTPIHHQYTKTPKVKLSFEERQKKRQER